MTPRPSPVKPKRPYDTRRRREQAQRNRDRIIGAAERLFLRDGYASTTIAAIAADAELSQDSVYKTFGGKPGLVRAIREKALAGTGPVPAEQRSDALQTGERDPRAVIEAWGELTAEIAPRVAPILLLVRAAATTDPEVNALLREMDDDRLRRMTDNARRMRDAGHLRAGITLSQAADVLWTYSAPELYELLVTRRGWSPKRFGRFVADAMIEALL
jgi:AcrR family transcriptional regulator